MHHQVLRDEGSNFSRMLLTSGWLDIHD